MSGGSIAIRHSVTCSPGRQTEEVAQHASARPRQVTAVLKASPSCCFECGDRRRREQSRCSLTACSARRGLEWWRKSARAGLVRSNGAPRRPARFYRMSAICQPTTEKLVAGACDRQYRPRFTWSPRESAHSVQNAACGCRGRTSERLDYVASSARRPVPSNRTRLRAISAAPRSHRGGTHLATRSSQRAAGSRKFVVDLPANQIGPGRRQRLG